MRPKIKSWSYVKPATATPMQLMSLSNLDRVVNPTYVSLILFYENLLLGCRGYEEVVQVLKESLSRVLVHFYPLAGNLVLTEEGTVKLHCDDAGVIFLEASMDLSLEEWGGPRAGEQKLSGLDSVRIGRGPRYVPDQLTPIPALILQLTAFRCGSVALAASWHHTVCDGFSGIHFMKSWAEEAVGKPIAMLPCHDRSLLNPRTPLDPSLISGYSTRVTTEGIRESYPSPSVQKRSPGFPAVVRSFRFRTKAVKLLEQQLAESESETELEPKHFTTVDCISAYLWRLMTEARQESPDRKSNYITRFFLFVDGRKALNLPPGYFGNVVASACAEGTENDIMENSLRYSAELIQTAKKKINAQYFRSLIDWVELQDSVSRSNHETSAGHDVAATFWTYFQLYVLDFGWGKPTYAGRNGSPRDNIDGIAMMPSFEGPGTMTALINLNSKRLERLSSFPRFQKILSE